MALTALVATLSGCNATTSTLPRPSAPSVEEVRPEPKWTQLVEGSDLTHDANHAYYPSELMLSNGYHIRGDDWAHIEKFVLGLPIEKRDAVLQAVTRHVVDYDKVEQVIRFEPLRLMSGPYSRRSYVGTIGTLSEGKTTALAKFFYYGKSWIFAESFKVVCDEVPYQSERLRFRRDNYGGNVWEYAFLDLQVKENRELIRCIANAEEAIVRFQGNQYYSDLTVSDAMKMDLGLMLRAYEVLSL